MEKKGTDEMEMAAKTYKEIKEKKRCFP